ncbi:MAG: hypothetical protein COA44_02210 [Arcobacter sp.]|nr:MAG: hypothetical protein COA44_02210 [Arcobacter sp.]
MNKAGIYIIMILFIGYYGVFALFGGEVYIRYEGFHTLELYKSLIFISLGTLVFIGSKYKKWI